MDPTTVFCPNRHCPARGQTGLGNIGVHSRKDKRFICHACHQTFSATTGTIFYRLRTSAETVVLVVTLLAHGCPVQAIVAAFGFDERTVANWWARSGRQSQAVHESLVEQPRDLRQVQADEIRVKKQGGIVWMALAMMVKTRLWLGGEVSEQRDMPLIRRLIARVRRCAARRPLLVCTDGLVSYIRAIRETFRDPVHTGTGGRPRLRPWRHVFIAQVVKCYERRRVVATERRIVDGTPTRVETLRRRSQGGGVINTAYIERLNATGSVTKRLLFLWSCYALLSEERWRELGIMDYELRIVVEKVASSSQEVMKRDTITSYALQCPTSIVELGLRHAEQIALLKKVQNLILEEQSRLLDPGMPVCPTCGNTPKKNGYKTSNFHAIFSDHTVRIQKQHCSHPDCGWHSTPTITALFGTNIHPDLATLQCAQGALYSYREAEKNLAQWNGHPRRVNNHTHVKRITDKVGAVLSEHNGLSPSPEECATPAQDLILQVDGGHIPTQEKDKRSFEALAAIVYRPEAIQAVDQHHRQIMEKTCVISARDDQLHTIKTSMVNAAKKQGLSQATRVTALADGATNCWAVVTAIQPECATLECILDWFHIGKKFQNVKNALGEAFTASLESAKWKLWHGHVDDALRKLAMLRDNVSEETQRSKLTGLYEYLHRNQAYLVNYDAREQANQTYTSQVAESHVDALINARHKRTKKMQWTREGAHHVLQIRAMMASEEWESKRQGAVLSALRAVA